MFAWARKQEPRLENWDGRKHSTRDGGTVLPRIWSRPIALRLLMVFVAAAGLVALLAWNSPPFPYRHGAVLPHDFRARVAFEVPNQAFAAQHLAETHPDSDEETRAPSESPPVDRYAAGAILVKHGQRIDVTKLVLLMAEHRAYAASLSFGDRTARLLSTSLIVMLLAILLALYVSRFQPALAESYLRVASVCFLVLLNVGLALLLSRPPWDAAIIPLTVTAMVLAIVFNPPFALLLSFCTSIVLSIGQGTGLGMMLTHSGGLATAILMLKEIRSRTRPVEVSALAGIAFLSLTVATGMLGDQPARLFLVDGMRYFLWSLLAGFILCGSLPFIERCFGVMTDASLLELADSSHPLMQELVRRAPGTYTHSMTVATLADAYLAGDSE